MQKLTELHLKSTYVGLEFYAQIDYLRINVLI